MRLAADSTAHASGRLPLSAADLAWSPRAAKGKPEVHVVPLLDAPAAQHMSRCSGRLQLQAERRSKVQEAEVQSAQDLASGSVDVVWLQRASKDHSGWPVSHGMPEP